MHRASGTRFASRRGQRTSAAPHPESRTMLLQPGVPAAPAKTPAPTELAGLEPPSEKSIPQTPARFQRRGGVGQETDQVGNFTELLAALLGLPLSPVAPPAAPSQVGATSASPADKPAVSITVPLPTQTQAPGAPAESITAVSLTLPAPAGAASCPSPAGASPPLPALAPPAAPGTPPPTMLDPGVDQPHETGPSLPASTIQVAPPSSAEKVGATDPTPAVQATPAVDLGTALVPPAPPVSQPESPAPPRFFSPPLKPPAIALVPPRPGVIQAIPTKQVPSQEAPPSPEEPASVAPPSLPAVEEQRARLGAALAGPGPSVDGASPAEVLEPLPPAPARNTPPDPKPTVGLGSSAPADPPSRQPPAQPAGPAEQLARALVSRAEVVVRGGRTDFHLRLEPPELGSVRVHLVAVEHAVAARVVASDEGTRQALEKQLPVLRQALAEAGLSLKSFAVSGGGAGWRQGPGNGQQHHEPLPPYDPPRPDRPRARPAPSETPDEVPLIDVVA